MKNNVSLKLLFYKDLISVSAIICMLLIGMCCVVHAGDYKLPDTGIEKCYDNGHEIPCPDQGKPFYGQDAQYDGPAPAYQDNGDGTVTDLNTGLMWQQEDDDTRRTWQDAVDYCDALVFAGYSDWHLPTRRELFSIVNLGRYDPAIDTDYFPGCNSSYYWSGSMYASNSSDAWDVYFNHGYVYHYARTHNFYVRCVRSGP
ncbi:DUF1566 domain-containing protein [Desulfobacter latus]|uniref:DUF1566 domain-containing protein n=1 Tax=Desulfobacter latus TaxID=2292 RepID=A0A850T7T9_9BACT|nr:DUF1566 domain-containing protein [Desulfobacter latus]NWH05512.1 DUF1566 domain-containing protein [Desulfobacter latus]